MASTEVFTSRKSGALWILPNGPNTRPEYLPCHDLEDIQENRGSSTLIQCIDATGQYRSLDTTLDAPELATFQLSTFIGKVADFIETVKCPFPLIVNLRTCGRADSFENYDRSYIVQAQRITTVTLSGLVRKDEDVAAMHTFDVEAFPDILRIFRLTPLNESVSESADITDVTFLDDPSCWDSCGESNTGCSYGFATSRALGGSPSDIASVLLKTPTVGTWTPTAADPFAAGEDIAAVTVFKVGQNTTRILVARGTTDAGNPAEVAYSDDSGATWTNVNVGTTNGQYFVGAKSLISFNRYDIWGVTTGGYIYKSEDGGATWTAQESGVITSSNYYVIQFVPGNPSILYAGADDGTVSKTTNGGTTWGSTTAAPGSDGIVGLAVLSSDRVWVGDDTGHLFYTNDGGTTWNSRSYGGSTGASRPVEDIVFPNDYVGFLVQNVAGSGSLYKTINGGFSWELQTGMPTNTGFNAIYACDSNSVYLAANDGDIISLTQ